MEITASPDVNVGSIWLERPASGADVVLRDDVIVSLDGDRLTSIELLDLRRWGDPFDRAAAERVLAWVRARLRERAAAS